MAAFGPLGTLASAAGSSATAAYILGIVGSVTAVILYLSSVGTFINIWRNRSVGQNSVAPYMAGLLNCLLWGMYSLPLVHPGTGSTLMLVINGIGVVSMFIYTVIFLCFTADEERKYMLIYVLVAEGVFVVCLGALVLTVVPTHEGRRSFVLGVFGAIFGVSMYASPLKDIKAVREAGSVEGIISLPSSAASLVNAIIWMIYACINIFDPFAFVPNLVGVISALVQLGMFLRYPNNAAN